MYDLFLMQSARRDYLNRKFWIEINIYRSTGNLYEIHINQNNYLKSVGVTIAAGLQWRVAMKDREQNNFVWNFEICSAHKNPVARRSARPRRDLQRNVVDVN